MRKLDVLVACECSQEVTKAFRALGHNAFSCDIEPCYGGHPEWHIQGDMFLSVSGHREYWSFYTCDGLYHETERRNFDLIIAFPPCTYLARSGQRHCNVGQYGQKAIERIEEREKAIKFFLKCTKMIASDHIAIENPVGIMSNLYRTPDQIIQPWQFSADEPIQKSTCLWLKNLPPLVPLITEQPERDLVTWTDKRTGKEKSMERFFYETRYLPKADRQRIRSKTFTGIARAMAEQWSAYILNSPLEF